MASSARAQASSCRVSSKTSGTAPHPDQRASSACSAGVAGRPSRCRSRSARNAARLARMRLTAPDGARSPWPRGRNRCPASWAGAGQLLLLGVHLLPQRVAAVHDHRPARLARRRRLAPVPRVLVAGFLAGSRFRREQDPLRQDDLLGLQAGHVQPAHLDQVVLAGRVVPGQVQGQVRDLPGRLLPQCREEADRFADR